MAAPKSPTPSAKLPPLLISRDSYTQHGNTSEYTLATVRKISDGREYDDDVNVQSPSGTSPTTPLLSPGGSHATGFRSSLSSTTRNRRIINAALKMATVFLVSTAIMAGILWLALPKLDKQDEKRLHIPKSFDELKDLNTLLKKYRDIYPFRIVICFSVVYLFIQAFSIPGSMYLSILAGAVWGVPRALPLACTCVATGATLCYLISAALGPALTAIPWFARRLTSWSGRIRTATADGNLVSYLIILRISPLPPHWVVNLIAPHVDIGIFTFWISTWLGIFGVTVIHTTIGGGLDEMTSADDFHIISVQNALGLGAIVVGVGIPIALRRYFRKEAVDIQQTEELVEEADQEEEEEEELLPDQGGLDDESEGSSDEDDDIILPSVIPQGETNLR